MTMTMTMTMTKHTLSVGQTLWWVPSGVKYPAGETVTVLKVGKKVAKLSNKQSIEFWGLGAYGATDPVTSARSSSPGRCFLSRADYEVRAGIAATNEAWYALRAAWFIHLDGQEIPPGMTIADIDAVRKLLRLGPYNPPLHPRL